MKHIHYIAYFGQFDNKRNLNIVSSGITKMSYIISALKRAGYAVTVFSTANTKNRFWCHYKQYEEKIDAQEKRIYIDTFGSQFKIIRGISLLWIWLQLFYYLLFKVRKDDTVLVYHSCFYQVPIFFARIFKEFRLVIQVEEIYNVSWGNGIREQNREVNYLKQADAYILVNDIIAEKCGLNDKNSVVSYGSYSNTNIKKSETANEYIHLVYAGVIEKKKLGAFIAVESAKFLTEKYKLHILGFGTDDHIDELRKLITEVNQMTGRESVIYHGSMHGYEYSDFLSKCHIGLSTHTTEGDFVDLTFPSKLLVYIAHNVTPVCSSIACVEKSKIAKSVVFYRENTPQAVAEAVMSVDISRRENISDILLKLDEEFVVALKRLLD